MSVQTSVQSFGHSPVPGALPTSPTGAPVPADNAEGFLSMLLAALPTVDGAGETIDGLGATVMPETAAAEGAAEESEQGTEETGQSEEQVPALPGTSSQAGVPVPTPLELLEALTAGLPAVLRAPLAPTAQDATANAASAASAGTTDQASDAMQAALVGTATTDGEPVGTAPAATSGIPAATTASAAAAASSEATTVAAGGPAPAGDTGATDEARPGALRLPDGFAPVEQPAADGAASTDGAGPEQGPAGQSASSAAAQTSPQGSSQAGTGQGATQAATPVAPAAPTAMVATGQSADAGATTHVTRQVFPEVSRLVTRGDGTHKLTLTLAPAALGDVQVTLTLRAGAVTVSFAAADQAQAALLEGAPELRRLLESVGAQETRVLVRDLSATGTTPSTTSDPGNGPAEDRAPGSGAQEGSQGREAPTDEHARTRATHFATDGSTRGPGSSPPAPDPDTRRPGGVDVTV